MLIYLLKSSAGLAIFMVFYKFFLERENMHVFKRYYLLGALIIAFAIPLVTFTHYIEVEPLRAVNEPVEGMIYYNEDNLPITEINYLPIILWSIYCFGVLLFGTKFLINLLKIIFKIKRNPKQKSKHIIHVLLSDLVTPHTFFKYIFLNKQKFENNDIPQAVFWHEETHAKQKHSIDVLFVELLQVIFWFNPLIYFAKQAIKMNHEFLADQAVLNRGISPSTYQHILLAFSSNASESPLANAINYSSTRHAIGMIKKRFTVMKTQTSKRNMWLKSIMLLPLVALTLYGFSEREEIRKEIALQETFQINAQSRLSELSEQTLQLETPQRKATAEEVTEYNKLAKQINSQNPNKTIIRQKVVDRLHYLYDRMSKEQKEKAEPLPNLPPPPPTPPNINHIKVNQTTLSSPLQNKELVRVNGNQPVNDLLTMSRTELTHAELSIINGEIVSFKLKIPGKPTQSIKGNTMDAETKALIKSTLKKDAIQLFMIKNSDNQEHPPIMISIKE